MTKQTFSLLGRFWRNKPVRWSLLGILLPVSGVMTAYAVTEPLPQPSLYQAERITEELPAVYVDSSAYQGSYWPKKRSSPATPSPKCSPASACRRPASKPCWPKAPSTANSSNCAPDRA